MASFISQAEAYLLSLEEQIARLENEAAEKDAEIRRLLMRVSNKPSELAREATYLMVKPDGVQRRLVGEIIERLERKGFKLVALKMVSATKAQLEAHYADLGACPRRSRRRAAAGD